MTVLSNSSLIKISRITTTHQILQPVRREVCIESFIPQLTSLYQEPHRHYHNLTHIFELDSIILNIEDFVKQNVNHQHQAELLSNVPRLVSTLRAIAWFHDAYYNPYAPPQYNERVSARMANEMMLKEEKLLGCEYTNRLEILEGILATAEHLTVQTDISLTTKLFLDLDMFGFTLHRDLYNKNTENIRKEYYNTSDYDFKLGRRKFLNSLSNRPSGIFYLLNYSVGMRAIDNIERDIKGA